MRNILIIHLACQADAYQSDLLASGDLQVEMPEHKYLFARGVRKSDVAELHLAFHHRELGAFRRAGVDQGFTVDDSEHVDSGRSGLAYVWEAHLRL